MGYQIDYFLTLVVILPTILSGIETCFSSIALPQMNLTISQASWFAAGPGLTCAVGTLILGSILDAYGRKATLLISSFCHFVGWSTILCGENFATIFVGRLLTGLPASFVGYAAQVYIVECVAAHDKRLSDTLSTWPTIAFAVGQLVTFIFGALMTYLQFAMFVAILSLVLIVCVYAFVIESPSWLRQKGRYDDAQLASERLRINQSPILAKDGVRHGAPAAAPATATTTSPLARLAPSPVTRHGTDSNFSTIFQRFSHQRVYRPALIMTVTCMLALMTGGMALSSYMVNIIDASQPGSAPPATAAAVNATAAGNATATGATGRLTDTNSYRYSVVSGLLMVLGTGLLSWVLPRVGARAVTIWSAAFMCAGMLLIGYTNGRPDPAELMALRVLSVWLVAFIFAFGIVSVPFSILSAMFPLEARGFASLAIVMQVMAASAVSQTYPHLYLASPSGVFYGYAAMCVAYGCFVYAFVPETVGRDYEQIGADFED